MKQRNPAWGCPRIAQQITVAFGIPLNKDVVRRILAAAKPALNRARTIQETVLGDHPDLVTTLDDLATVLEGLDEFDAAGSVRERARAISTALDARPPRRRLLVD